MIKPSPKLSCARRISIMRFPAPLRRRSIRAQQVMIEFANRLDRLLQLLVVAQPPPNLVKALATNAQLPGAPARIAHRHDKDLMAFTARAFRAAARMTDRALQK